VDCGKVFDHFGDYVMCSMGKRTCDGSKWGACIGDANVTTKHKAAPLHTLGLADAGVTCGAMNPCDPYCSSFVDDATGLVFDAAGAG
jgi:hypothetical protein